MTNSDRSDPRRGPRRYGPSSSAPQAPNQDRSPDRPPTRAWSQSGPPPARRMPSYPASGPGAGPAVPPPTGYRSMSSEVPPDFRGSVPPGGPPATPPSGTGGPGGGDEPPKRHTNRVLRITRIVAVVAAAIVLSGAGVAYA